MIENIEKVSQEIRDIIEDKKKELELSFIEEDHIYFMKDRNGKSKK